MPIQIGRVNARVSFEITPVDEADPGARVHASGRLDLLLCDIFDKWEASEADEIKLHVGDVILPVDATREIFEAMKRIRDGG